MKKNVQIRFAIITLTFVLTVLLSGAVSAADDTNTNSGTNILAENATTNTSFSNSLNTSDKNSSAMSNQTLPDPIIEHNGVNGTTSYSTIQAAIDAAQAGDTIWLESGTYTTTSNYLNPALVYVTKNLTFKVFNGVTATIDGSNLYRCIWVNSGITANFYDVTITNGRSLNVLYYDGAGIFNDGGTVNLYNCVLDNNDGLWSGGGIYNNHGTIKIENGVITDNNVPTKGGAIYNNQGTVNIVGSTISGNSARNGGAIYNNNGTVTIDNSNINSNSVFDTGDNDGGAIYNENGLLSISGSHIMNNNADDNGGAIYNTGTTTITSTNIYSNTAFSGGAIYNTDIGTIIITGSSLYSNLAGNGTAGNPGGNGGAIYNEGASTITNCEIHDNQAGNGGNGTLGGNGGSGGNGGGIYASAGTMTITGGAIYNNHAGNGGSGSVLLLSGGNGGNGGSGGAIYTAATTTIIGTEIYSNTAGNGGNGANGADGLGHLIPGYSGGNGGSGGDGGAIYNNGALNIQSSEIYSNIAGNGGTGGTGGNGIRGTLTHSDGGTGGSGGAGGNAGGIYNFNHLMITTSTVNSNRSGNGGKGGSGGNGSDRYSSLVITIPSGSGGDGGNGGSSGFGAGIYNTGSYLEVTSNNLTNNFIGTPGNGGAAGSKGFGAGGTNGNVGVAGSSGDGGAFYSTVYVSNPQGLHFNRILNNSVHDIVAASGVSVSAENNWWGTNFQGTNPSNAGRVSSGVNASPWLLLTVTADSPICNGDTSQVTADLTHNSNNQDTSSQGHIPDGTPVTFALTNGPYGILAAPLEKYTVNGKTSIIFTANDPNAPHTQNVNTTVDHQNVTAQILISPLGHVKITKNANTTIPNYHSLVTFTITVTNNGPNNVSGLQVTDLLPAGLSFNSANTHDFGTYNPGNGVWDIGTLNNGATATLTLVANVTATGLITNWANVTSQTTPDELSFENASVTLNVPAAAYVDIYKEFRDLPWGTVITTANYHGTIYAMVRVQNEGPDPTSLRVLDSLTGIRWTGTYYVLSGTVLPLDSNNWVVNDSVNTFNGTYWNIPFLSSFMGGNVKWLAIEGLINQTGIVSNFANITSQSAYAYGGLSNATATLNVPQQSNLTLSKEFRSTINGSAITTANYGDNIYGILKVTNNGPDNATNIIINDVYSGYDYQGGYWVSYDNGSTWIYQDATSPFDGQDWTIPFLGNGQSIWLSIAGIVEKTGQNAVNNTATQTAQDQYHSGSWPSASALLNVPPSAYLTVDKEFRSSLNGSAVTHAHYGNMIWTVLQAWNNGPDGVWAIIKDTPHAGLSLSNSGWYYSTDGGATWNPGNGMYSIYNSSTHEWKIWIPGLSESSQWCYLAIPTQVTKTGTLTNEVEQTWQDIYAPEPFDHNTVNLNVPRQADVYVLIIPSKTHLTVGENVIITVKVGNNGPDSAQGVIVSYTVPEGFKFVGVSADTGISVYNPVTRTLTWNIGEVPLGDPYMYIVLKAVSSGTFKSTAEIVHETTYDPNTKNKASSAVITVQSPKHPVVPDVNPASKTIPLQHTGLPFAGFVLAVLAVFSGLAIPKRKN